MIVELAKGFTEFWDAVDVDDASTRGHLLGTAQRDIRLLVKLIESQDELLTAAMEYIKRVQNA